MSSKVHSATHYINVNNYIDTKWFISQRKYEDGEIQRNRM